jgi:hypothetical protein
MDQSPHTHYERKERRMSTPRRIPDPAVIVPGSVYAAAEAALRPVEALRDAVASSPLDRKLPKVRDGIMRSTAFLLKSMRELLKSRPPGRTPCPSVNSGPPGDTAALDEGAA